MYPHVKGELDIVINEKREKCCPLCKSARVFEDIHTREKICGECGFVLADERFDRGPEWRAFNQSERFERQRTGIPSSFKYADKGLFTTFYVNNDSNGRRLDNKTRNKMYRLKKHDVISKMDENNIRNLTHAMTELSRLADELHLPDDVKERAAIIYRLALKKDLIKGRTIAGFVAASVYASCRESGVPRTLKDVTDVSTEKYKDISRTYRFLIRKLHLKMPVDHPMKYVPRVASEIETSRETERYTIKLLHEANRRKILNGKDPMGMVAAALYLASKENGERITQKDVASAADTTEVTLRNRLKDIEEMVNFNQQNINQINANLRY